MPKTKYAIMMLMNNQIEYPLITIAITCYNYGEFVHSAIDSALEQDYPNIQVVVYDDGSTDDSLVKISQFTDDSRVSLITRENKGVIFTRNQALDDAIVAGAQYLVFLDADNIFPKNYLTRMFEVSQQTNADVVYSDVREFGDVDTFHKFPEFDYHQLLIVNYIDISALIKLSAIGDVRFDSNMEKLTHEDWEFFVNLASDGLKFVHAKDDTYFYYRNKVDSRNVRNVKDDLPDVRRRKYFEIVKYIIKKQQNKHPDRFLSSATHQMLAIAHWFNEVAEYCQRLRSQETEYKRQLEEQYVHAENLEKAVNMLNEEVRNQIELRRTDLEVQKDYINSIYQSSTWKLGSLLTWLPRKLKKLLSKSTS
jgi:glycosyltransferase involved in cell wall biosynthesis